MQVDRISSETSPTGESRASEVESKVLSEVSSGSKEGTPSTSTTSDILEETRPATGTLEAANSTWPLDEHADSGEADGPQPTESPNQTASIERKRVRFSSDTPFDYSKTAERVPRARKAEDGGASLEDKAEGEIRQERSLYTEGEPDNSKSMHKLHGLSPHVQLHSSFSSF